MDCISELTQILSGFLTWNKARLDCFSRLLLALFAVRTVNLRELAVAFSGEAAIDSRYKRIKRFFAHFTFDRTVMAQWMFQLFFSEQPHVYVILDRTNWFWGKAKINILMLGAAYEGVAIPLCWQTLNKAGNATAKEHQHMIEHFIKVFGKTRILGIIADREFASEALLGWLNKHHIPFFIRIKEDTQVSIYNKKHCNAKHLFNDLNLKQMKPFMMAVWILNNKVFLAASRSERGELMIIATNQEPRTAVAIYLRRWEIENLFQGLKSRGFRFEETHLTQRVRIEKLMALLAMGFCWAHKIGEWRALRKPILLNHYRASRRPQYSYFRYGLDLIREIVLQLTARKSSFKRCLALLIPLTDLLKEAGV